MGTFQTFGLCISLLSGYISPRIASEYGTSTALGLGAIASLIGLFILALYLRFKSGTIKKNEVTSSSSSSNEFSLAQVKQLNLGVFLICLDGMLVNGVIFGSIAQANNLLVVRYSLDEVSAGTACVIPYLVTVVLIPFLVTVVRRYQCNMEMIYLMGVTNIIPFIIWLLPPNKGHFLQSVTPMALLGVSYSIYWNLMAASLPYVVPEKLLGTALGLQSICQNLGFMVIAQIFSKVHDYTLQVENGYYYSILSYLTIAIASLLVKVQLGVWNNNQGGILSNSVPYDEHVRQKHSKKSKEHDFEEMKIY